jgi:4-hydroxy-3-polyprenylbenzoate decarboxylase
VDDDIDPTNLTDVLWAMTTRCVPENQIDIVRGALAGQIDPVLSPAKRESGDFTCGRVLIDACKPWEWKDRFAKSMTYEPGYWQEMREKWAPVLRGNE